MIWLLKICVHTKAQVWFMKMECNMQACLVHSSLLQKTPYDRLLLKSFSWPWMISWTAAGSSRVLRSPKPSKSLSTTLRSTRRIILPERVFGRRLANCDEHQHNEKLLNKVRSWLPAFSSQHYKITWMKSGEAYLAIFSDTMPFSCLDKSASCTSMPFLSTTKA